MALIEHCPHSAREKDSGVMAGGCVTSSSGSCPFRFVAFPIRIPRCRRRRVYVVLDCPLGVLADWSQWSWVRRRVVFVTGRGGAGFLIVTPPSLRPGVNILSFLPAPRRTGP